MQATNCHLHWMKTFSGMTAMKGGKEIRSAGKIRCSLPQKKESLITIDQSDIAWLLESYFE